MRIIIALHQYFPDFSAGTETLADQLARALIVRGHEVLIFSGHPAPRGTLVSERFGWSEYKGVPVLRFFHQHKSLPGMRDVVRQEYDSELVFERFGSLLDEWRPDCVHFFNFARISSSPAGCCSIRRIPFFYTATDFWSVCLTARLQLEDGRPCHGPAPLAANCVEHLLELKLPLAAAFLKPMPWLFNTLIDCSHRSVLKSSFPAQMLHSLDVRLDVIRERLEKAEAIWVPTRLMRQVLERNGFMGENVKVLPYGVDLERVMCRRLRTSSETLHVGFIGTISYHKGLHDLVKAFGFLEGLSVQLSIFGDETKFTEYVDSFRDEIHADERMRFKGTFPGEKIDAIIDWMDVLVIPSVWRENSPLVMLEAIARKCPVIVSRQEGMLDFVVDEMNGLLFDAGNPASLACALRRLVSEPGLLEKLSAGCEMPMGLDDYVAEVEAEYISAVQ